MNNDFGFVSFDKVTSNDDNDFGFVSFDPMMEQKQEEESLGKSAFRTLYQIPSGISQAVTYPLDLLHAAGLGEALDPLEIERLQEISKREGIPFDEEQYRKTVQSASEYFPTQSNAERIVEEKTGLPLTPKTKTQKLIKLGSSAGKFSPGSASQKAAAAVTAPAVSGTLQAAGAPEIISDLAGLTLSGVAGAVTPKISVAKTKPSGLTARRFEKVREPREVSAKRFTKINETLEKDFKEISDNIISKSPAEKTRQNLIENPSFKSEIRENFKKVEDLAEAIPEKINTDTIKKTLIENALKKKGTGFAPSEYDKDYRKFIVDFVKETPSQEIGSVDLVRQYRKNNKSLSEAYDPVRSRAFNRAKKDALLEYNKAISDVIEKKFPDSQFSNLFKENNKQWSEIMDVEAIDKFMDDLFSGKVNFKKGERFFENENMARPFKRALGEENYKAFEQLMKDLMQTEVPMRMLKIAKQKGLKDLFQTAAAYIVHPKLGHAKAGIDVTKKTYNAIKNALLDKPQLSITWKKAVDDLKKGNFSEAEKNFLMLDSEVKKIDSTRSK
jgi:hypothetical protein